MLSEHKSVLRALEVCAIAGAAGSVWLAVQGYLRPDPDFPVFLVSCAGMAVLLLTFLPACMLAGEYVRTVRKPTTWRGKTEGLSSNEIQAIVGCAPMVYKVAACIGVLIAISAAMKFGSITFTDGQVVRPEEVTGLALYFCMFFLLALPVLGSASRMRGPYASSAA